MKPQAIALRWGPVAACAAVLIWHSLRFDFVTDDAYISFVFTRNLVEHGELAFNPGDPVEGYTNFLWTVLLAVPMLLGIPPEIAARVLGTGFAIGTLVVVFRLMERLIGHSSGGEAAVAQRTGGGSAPPVRKPREATPIVKPWAYAPPLLLALSSGFACWSSGGLETQLFTFLVAAALDAYVAADTAPHRMRAAGVFLALAAMTRPEGLLVTAILGAHWIALAAAARRWPPRPHLEGLLAFALVWAPWFAWRWWYYGWPFPNTYYVKAAGETTARYDRELRSAGFTYVGQWLDQARILWASPLLVAGLISAARPRWRFVSLAVPLAGVYLAYVISVGGDFMGLHRFIMPLFVIAAVLVGLGVDRIATLLPDQRRRDLLGIGVAVVIAVGFAIHQHALTERSRWPRTAEERSWKGIDSPGYLIAYTENRAAIGKAMAGCFRDDDFSIVGGAGAQPYFARMRGIDVFGLVSSRIAHEVAPTNPRPGHNKWGPDPLLAEHDPDFVFSCYAFHPTDRPPSLGRCARFWQERGFVVATVRVPGLDGAREGRGTGDRYSFLVRADRDFDCPGLVK
jgi:hypothetical protein